MRPTGAKSKEQQRATTGREQEIESLFVAHHLSAERFEDESRDHARLTIKALVKHPLLSPLDNAASMAACFYLFRAHMADRLKRSAKYWVLDGIGPEHPLPLGIRTGYFPRWKRLTRTVEKILKELERTINVVDQVETGLVPSRYESMPCFLLTDACMKLQEAIAWMNAFPSPTELRSKYRKAIRPDPDSESTEVAAYVLDKLFRERSTQHLKVKDIECRISQIESGFLGASMDSDPRFGCPAVRAQIKKVKNWKKRAALDSELEAHLKSNDFILRPCSEAKELGTAEFKKRSDAQLALLDEFGKHIKAYSAWTESTEVALKSNLRTRLIDGMSGDELLKVIEEYHAEYEKHLTARHRWLSELDNHTKATRSLNGEFYKNVQAARLWMAKWERIWKGRP